MGAAFMCVVEASCADVCRSIWSVCRTLANYDYII